MPDPQRSIAKSVRIQGRGLFSGLPVTMCCRPAEPDTGIVFHRVDLASRPAIPARVEHVPARGRWTALRVKSAEVRLVEHFLAAAAGLGIDNVHVEVDAEEMPIADGSALSFVKMFRRAGIVEQGRPKRPIVVTQPLHASEHDATLVALPHDHGLTLSYMLDYGDRFVKTQSFTLNLAEEAFATEIAPARTYVLRPEIEQFRSQGLGKGATARNVVVVETDGRIKGRLRFPDECVRHKVLDMLGDLSLAGMPLQAHVMGHKSGHAANIRLARAIREAHQHMDEGPVLDIRGIQQVLPHRYPFLLVDKVLEIEDNVRAVGVKNVTCDEPFFQGHWPDYPVMPGVLQLEAMAQLAGILLLRGVEMKGRLAVVAGMDKVKLRRRVVPGDRLILEARVLRFKSRAAEVRTRATVDGKVAAEAEMRFVLARREHE